MNCAARLRLIHLYEDALNLIAHHPVLSAEYAQAKSREALSKRGDALSGRIYAQLDEPCQKCKRPKVRRFSREFCRVTSGEPIQRGVS